LCKMESMSNHKLVADSNIAGRVVAEKISLGLARIEYSSRHHARKYVSRNI